MDIICTINDNPIKMSDLRNLPLNHEAINRACNAVRSRARAQLDNSTQSLKK